MITDDSNPGQGAGLAEAEQRLAAARNRGDADELAQALAVHANVLVQRGQLANARDEVGTIVETYHQLGRDQEEARYAVLGATLSRLLRQLPAARTLALHAAALAAPGSPSSVSVAAELGEIALLAGQHAEAAASFARALAEAQAIELPAAAHIGLLRKQATALVADRRFTEAVQALATARALALQQGDPRAGLLIEVEQVTALQQSGDATAADEARREALHSAAAAGDHFALAQLYLLEATRAIEQRDQAAALTAIRAARTYALQANAAVPYLSAAIGLADLGDAIGDRLTAYESLAKAWATLSDLIGRETAQAAVEPKLQSLRAKWGPEEFALIKATYESRRAHEVGLQAGHAGG